MVKDRFGKEYYFFGERSIDFTNLELKLVVPLSFKIYQNKPYYNTALSLAEGIASTHAFDVYVLALSDLYVPKEIETEKLEFVREGNFGDTRTRHGGGISDIDFARSVRHEKAVVSCTLSDIYGLLIASFYNRKNLAGKVKSKRKA